LLEKITFLVSYHFFSTIFISKDNPLSAYIEKFLTQENFFMITNTKIFDLFYVYIFFFLDMFSKQKQKPQISPEFNTENTSAHSMA